MQSFILKFLNSAITFYLGVNTMKYYPVSDERRRELIRLIYEDRLSIRQAAIQQNISYPTAKAINRIYKHESRIEKKKVRVPRIKRFAVSQALPSSNSVCDKETNRALEIGQGLRPLTLGKIKIRPPAIG